MEGSQKETHKYHILTHTHGIQKNSADARTCGQRQRRRCREGTWAAVREGEMRTSCQSGADMHTPPCAKRVAGRKLLCDTGGPAWHCDDLQGGWGAEGGGTHIIMTDSCGYTAETNATF